MSKRLGWIKGCKLFCLRAGRLCIFAALRGHFEEVKAAEEAHHKMTTKKEGFNSTTDDVWFRSREVGDTDEILYSRSTRIADSKTKN